MIPQRRSRWLGGLIFLLLCYRAAAWADVAQVDAPAASLCEANQYRWMQRALDTWALVSRSALELPADSLPWIVLFDEVCAWHLAPKGPLADVASDVTKEASLRFGEAPVTVKQLVHSDSIRLPSGQVVPAHPTAFASLYQADSASFFVMALPSLWRRRSAEEAADPALDEFFLGVLAHEMAHTTHLTAVVRQVQAVGRRWPLPANLNDDIIQQQFETIPGFRHSIEQETDALFRAAAAPDDSTRKSLTREALALAEERRARHFTGERAVYAPLEDLFLMMEGVGSWAAYRGSLAHAPPGTARNDVVNRLRQGTYWSQDMGLAIFLVLDELLPEWKSRVFADEPASVSELLGEAVQPR